MRRVADTASGWEAGPRPGSGSGFAAGAVAAARLGRAPGLGCHVGRPRQDGEARSLLGRASVRSGADQGPAGAAHTGTGPASPSPASTQFSGWRGHRGMRTRVGDAPGGRYRQRVEAGPRPGSGSGFAAGAVAAARLGRAPGLGCHVGRPRQDGEARSLLGRASVRSGADQGPAGAAHTGTGPASRPPR